jgi:hypothetical protein
MVEYWGEQTVCTMPDGAAMPRFGDDEYVAAWLAGGYPGVEDVRAAERWAEYRSGQGV